MRAVAAAPISRIGPSGQQAVRPAEEVGDLADAGQAEQQHDDAAEPHAEPAVRGHPVAEEVEVELELLRLEPLLAGLRLEHLDAVLALGARRDLDAVEDEVVAVR